MSLLVVLLVKLTRLSLSHSHRKYSVLVGCLCSGIVLSLSRALLVKVPGLGGGRYVCPCRTYGGGVFSSQLVVSFQRADFKYTIKSTLLVGGRGWFLGGTDIDQNEKVPSVRVVAVRGKVAIKGVKKEIKFLSFVGSLVSVRESFKRW